MLVLSCPPSAQTSSRAVVVACLLAVSLTTASGFAEESADRAPASALAQQGCAALTHNEHEIAKDRSRRTDTLVHAPKIVVDRGRALMGLGRYVEANECFELAVREGVAQAAPESWKEAVEDAAALREEVRHKIAWLTVVVSNVSAPTISVDGEPIPPAAVGVPRATDPGSRSITVSAKGYVTRRMTVELAEGKRRTMRIVLDRQQYAREEPVAPTPSTEAPQIDDAPEAGGSTLTYIALGVGGAGLAVGITTGLMFLSKHSDLDAVCGDDTCPRSAESDLKTHDTLGTVSGVSFAVGVAGAVTGIVCLLGKPDDAPAQPMSSARLELAFGPTGVNIQGAF